jgi:D-alanyl-D-alanine carboxypeptidase (penicillin-binding protein 5/6)
MRIRVLFCLLAGVFLAVAMMSGARAQAPALTYATAAQSAIMIDGQSGAVLYAKDADRPVPPASMAKVMTVYVAFEMLQRGLITLEDQVTVSPETWKAWNNQGSTMFLSPNQQVTIDALLGGIIIASGNDACVVLAEGLAGSEAAYVDLMNQAAKRLGLSGSRFTNTTGWPDPNQIVTARDLARLGAALIRDFPDLYAKYYGQREITFGATMGGKPITQGNRNPLLGRVTGADGVKTGHTEEAGYGLLGSAARNGQRLVTVVTGLPSMAARADEAVRFMEWGFRTFQRYPLFARGTVVEQVPVWLGTADQVAVAPDRDIAMLLPRMARPGLQARVRYTGPVAAPIAAGQHIADLVVTAPGLSAQAFPLKATTAVDKASGFARVMWRLRSMFGGATPEAQPAS